MNYILLSDAEFSEVLCRVAYRVIVREFPRSYNANWRYGGWLGILARGYQDRGFDVIATWILAYANEVDKGERMVNIRNAMIFRARLGLTWRHVAYPDYKNHYRDPRVTNRGVASVPRSRKVRGQ